MRVLEGAGPCRLAAGAPFSRPALACSSRRLCAVSRSTSALSGSRRAVLGSRTRRLQAIIRCSAAPKQADDSPGWISAAQEVAQLAAAPKRVRAAGEEATEGGAKAAKAGLDAKLSELRASAKAAYDRVYYGDVIPPIGSYQISYARMLQMLHDRKIKRIILLSDGRTAIVEVPVENMESDVSQAVFDRRHVTVAYAPELPEWQMEKNRYYVELPGDVWEEGTLMHLIKNNQEKRVYIDGVVRVPYENMLQIGQVRPELQVVDPGDAYVFLNEYSSQFLPILGLLALRAVVGAVDVLLKRMGKKKKGAQEELAEELGRHRAKEYNVPGEGGKKGSVGKGTGVSYADVAGIDHIKGDIQEILDILLGDEDFKAMGAHPLRGVLFEGPPGTGKTLLAKAMAGEAGIPFYSANGAEFVEMFQGVAAARIRSLFKAARKNAPSIIFIDEIDAIGKARSTGPTDSGTQEREQGLMQMLTEMDGFYQKDNVLVVGATNRVDALDQALLRPGRFDRTIYMGRPTPSNRLRILQVHAKNKPIDRSNDDAVLRTISELAIGFSGAELANLLNEGAILAVRKGRTDAEGKLTIDLATLKEAMDKVRLGLPHQSLPESAAKRQYAAIEAARAVAFALTPGLPPIEHVTIRPRGNTITRILFVPQDYGKDGGSWHMLGVPGNEGNAVPPLEKPLTDLEKVYALLTPLYASRACEEVLYGKGAASLSTSKEISKAGELARWIVMDSKLHPATRDERVSLNVRPGGEEDPTVKWAQTNYDGLILDLQQRAYESAIRLVMQRRSVIETVAGELCDNSDETVLGSRIVDLLRNTPLDEVAEPVSSSSSSSPAVPAPDSAPAPEAVPAAEAEAIAAAEAEAEAATGGSAPESGSVPEGGGPADSDEEAAEPSSSNGGERAAAAEPAAGGGAAAREALGEEVMRDESWVRLAEVVMGKIEEWDLLPGAMARTKAAWVREQLLDPAVRQRLEAQRKFARSVPGDGTPYPPPPPMPPVPAGAAGPDDVGKGLDAFMPERVTSFEL